MTPREEGYRIFISLFIWLLLYLAGLALWFGIALLVERLL